MKALVCVVLLLAIFSSGITSDSERYGVDLFMSKLFFRQNSPPEIPSAKAETDSHGEKLIEIERSLKEMQLSLQEKLLEFEKNLKHVEDSLTGKYETLQDKDAELGKNRTAMDDAFQQSMERSTQEKYESLQSTLMELENNITARDDSMQEIERSIKFDKSLKENNDSINQRKNAESMEHSIEKRYENLQSTLMELANNITARDNSFQDIERSLKELQRDVKEQDDAYNGKLIETENHAKAKDNTLQEMKQNMTILEDLSKVKYEELKAYLSKLQNETRFLTKLTVPSSCKAVTKKQSGQYSIHLGNGEFKTVFCEQAAFDGGWIVFQYRFNGKVDFYRTWAEYRDGFGTLDGEFWLGLKYLHLLTSTRKLELMVEVKDYHRNYGYAKYDHFEIGSEEQKFVLKLGNYSGTAGDGMRLNNGMKFTTKDSDNDNDSSRKCAQSHHGGWWYNQCTGANPNGEYGHFSGGYAQMYWYNFMSDDRAMVYTRMMLRETN